MNIKDNILFQNQHWGKGEFTTFSFKRHLFSKIWQDIDTKLIALVTGPRRVGKSILIKQLINQIIIDRKVDPQQILLFEFSSGSRSETIWEVFSYFSKEVADPRLPRFFFFDEIQYVERYESVIKEIYDNSLGSKIFLTGSLSLSYKRKMEESLAGRFFPYRLFPLNFAEYLELAKPESFTLYKMAQKEKNKLKRQYDLSILNSDFRNFLAYARLPEIVSFTKKQSVSYFKTIVNQSLNQDAFSYFDIEKPQVINSLFEYLRVNNGGLVSVNSLAKELKVSNQTISLYINILEIMGLIYLVYNSTNPLVKLNSAKKSYVNSAFALLETKLIPGTAMGFAAESYVLERLMEEGETVTFWRKRNKEVDFLIPKKKIAYEVKFRSQTERQKISLKGYTIKTISLDEEYPTCLF